MNEGLINFKEIYSIIAYKIYGFVIAFFHILEMCYWNAQLLEKCCGKNNHFRRYWILKSLRCLVMSIPPFISEPSPQHCGTAFKQRCFQRIIGCQVKESYHGFKTNMS